MENPVALSVNYNSYVQVTRQATSDDSFLRWINKVYGFFPTKDYLDEVEEYEDD